MGIQGKTTRLSLIGRLGDKADQEAWFEFVEIYEPLVFNLVSRSGIQYSDAKEVTQQVLTQVLTSIDRRDHVNAKGTFRGWLYRITRNRTIDFLRKDRKQQRGFELADLDQVADSTLPDDNDFHLEYEKQLFRWASDQAKTKVSATNWQAFWSTSVEGKTIPDVAKQLGISAGTVHVARSRIMARITRLIQSRMAETTDHAAQEARNDDGS